jgi:hypothetical protein
MDLALPWSPPGLETNKKLPTVHSTSHGQNSSTLGATLGQQYWRRCRQHLDMQPQLLLEARQRPATKTCQKSQAAHTALR